MSSPSSPESAELVQLRIEHGTVVRALQEAIRDTTRLTRLFAVLSEAMPLEKLLDRLLATLSELFLSDIVELFDATSNSGLVPLAVIGLPGGAHPSNADHTGGSHAHSALTNGIPVVVDDAQADPKLETLLRELGTETAVWLPVMGDEGTRCGVLMLARCQPLPFARADVELLSTITYRIGLLVERAHADQVRRMLEVKLNQTEKTESLGRMAAAVAHHFNNTLATVVTSLELALEELPVTHTSRDDLTRAREATLGAAKTAELMLAYLGQSAGERETVDLVRFVECSLTEHVSTLPPHVHLVSDPCDAALTISANPGQLSQLLRHLLTNAAEAIGTQCGQIRVTTRALPNSDVGDSYPFPDSPLPPAAVYACLEVSDSGCGMSTETQKRIFDPFFTTKFVGRGLGLSVVLGTVRAHGGRIAVESVAGQGTTVRVLLPLSSPMLSIPVAPTATHSTPMSGPRLALLAEDEYALRRATQRLLNRLGYQVISAADGLEAVELFRKRSHQVQLVVLDLAMPRLDGWATLEQLRALRPDVPVILASGYDEAHALEGRPVHSSLVYLHKPYTLADMRSALDRLIGLL